MQLIDTVKAASVIAMVTAFAGCSSWHSMDRTESTFAAGAAGGAVAGAVVAGPVGAVVGGVGGAYVGHETTGKEGSMASSTPYHSAPSNAYDPAVVRSVQRALNDRGYGAGPVDGQWGPGTQDAVRRFQQASGLPQTGELGHSTLVALGVS